MNASSLWVPNNKYGEFSFGKKSPYSGSEFRWYRTYNDTTEENIAFLQNDHRGLSIKISDDEYGTVLSIHAETEVNYLGTNLVGKYRGLPTGFAPAPSILPLRAVVDLLFSSNGRYASIPTRLQNQRCCE